MSYSSPNVRSPSSGMYVWAFFVAQIPFSTGFAVEEIGETQPRQFVSLTHNLRLDPLPLLDGRVSVLPRDPPQQPAYDPPDHAIMNPLGEAPAPYGLDVVEQTLTTTKPTRSP